MMLQMAKFHSVDGRLCCFRILAIVNNTAINFGVHVFSYIGWFFPDIYPGVGLLDHAAVLSRSFVSLLRPHGL